MFTISLDSKRGFTISEYRGQVSLAMYYTYKDKPTVQYCRAQTGYNKYTTTPVPLQVTIGKSYVEALHNLELIKQEVLRMKKEYEAEDVPF